MNKYPDRIDYKTNIIGKWKVDPEDFNSLKKFGLSSMIFSENGELLHITHEADGRNLVSMCTYAIKDNFLIVDQPSSPREERIKIDFISRDNLMLDLNGNISHYIRQ